MRRRSCPRGRRRSRSSCTSWRSGCGSAASCRCCCSCASAASPASLRSGRRGDAVLAHRGLGAARGRAHRHGAHRRGGRWHRRRARDAHRARATARPCIVKVALAAAAHRRSARSTAAGRSRASRPTARCCGRCVAIEIVAALGVFGLTGTLTSLNPDGQNARPARPEAPSIAASGADFATTTRVTLTASPGGAGPNTFEASIVDYDDGTPIEADEVTVLMSAIGRPEIEPATLPLEPRGSPTMAGRDLDGRRHAALARRSVGRRWSRCDPGRARPRCRSSSSRAPPRRPRPSPRAAGAARHRDVHARRRASSCRSTSTPARPARTSST